MVRSVMRLDSMGSSSREDPILRINQVIQKTISGKRTFYIITRSVITRIVTGRAVWRRVSVGVFVVYNGFRERLAW